MCIYVHGWQWSPSTESWNHVGHSYHIITNICYKTGRYEKELLWTFNKQIENHSQKMVGKKRSWCAKLYCLLFPFYLTPINNKCWVIVYLQCVFVDRLPTYPLLFKNQKEFPLQHARNQFVEILILFRINLGFPIFIIFSDHIMRYYLLIKGFVFGCGISNAEPFGFHQIWLVINIWINIYLSHKPRQNRVHLAHYILQQLHN